jgi:histidine phosphotransferase ChpT
MGDGGGAIVSDDLRLVELLAARLCHDLVGPVGAVANGAELLIEDATGRDPEVINLIDGSARQASRRLQVFRAAFGTGGSLGGDSRMDEVRRLAAPLFDGSHTALDWPERELGGQSVTGQLTLKLGLNLVLIAHEALPRGGTVRMRVVTTPGRVMLRATAEGPSARLADEMRAALNGCRVQDLSPRTVTAYLMGRIAREAGGVLAVSPPSATAPEVSVDLPAGI